MPRDTSHTSEIYVQCTPKQKARYVQTANRNNMKLGEWVRDRLDRIARFDDEPPRENEGPVR